MAEGIDAALAAAKAAIQSNARLIRTAALLIIIAAVVIGGAIGIAEYVRWRLINTQKNVRLTFTKEGAAIITDANDRLHATFPMPASAPWLASGITVPPKTSVRITASGRIHLAAHHVVEAARQDERPPFSWIGPQGHDYESPRPKDHARRNLLIDPNSNMGALLACLRATSEPPPSIPHNPHPSRLKYVGEGTILTNSEDSPLELWFCINDIALDPRNIEESEKAYRTPEIKPGTPEWDKETLRWKYVKDHSYWTLWWDDNIGQFHILIEEAD